MKLGPDPREPIIAIAPWQRFAICTLIFLLAFGVGVLSLHDTRLEVAKVQTGVAADYERVAYLLRQGGPSSFFRATSPLADLNNLGHPPGYSILLALVHSIFGDSSTAMQLIQITCDELTAVVILIIIAELLPTAAASIAGLLAAFSPQFAWNSVLLLPDSIAVFPILLAVYFVTRGIKNPRLAPFLVAGGLIGISCWLRANAMLLTFFVAGVPLVLLRHNRGPRYALAVIIGTILIVLPLTIRNAIVVHRFIPLSLGAGQTLLEGIAEYDPEGHSGIPKTDIGIMKQEAEQFGRPDYYGTLFNPDGVERERARLLRGVTVIRAHPLWFAGVMVRRAASMLRLERSRLIALEPPVSNSLEALDTLQPVWTKDAQNLFLTGISAAQTKVSNELLTRRVSIEGTDSKYGDQFWISGIACRRNTDYVFTVPVKIEQGRMRISVKNSNAHIYSSKVVETVEQKLPEEQPVNQIQLPFVIADDEPLKLVFSNEATNPSKPMLKIGTVKLFELGPARSLWTRYPRFVVNGLQRLFLTAVMLPLAIVGVILLIVRGRWQVLIILLVVPFYYFFVQSIVHTEYRYVLAVHYFLFALAAVAIAWVVSFIFLKLRASRLMPARSSR